jgi:hypothetical protein
MSLSNLDDIESEYNLSDFLEHNDDVSIMSSKMNDTDNQSMVFDIKKQEFQYGGNFNRSLAAEEAPSVHSATAPSVASATAPSVASATHSATHSMAPSAVPSVHSATHSAAHSMEPSVAHSVTHSAAHSNETLDDIINEVLKYDLNKEEIERRMQQFLDGKSSVIETSEVKELKSAVAHHLHTNDFDVSYKSTDFPPLNEFEKSITNHLATQQMNEKQFLDQIVASHHEDHKKVIDFNNQHLQNIKKLYEYISARKDVSKSHKELMETYDAFVDHNRKTYEAITETIKTIIEENKYVPTGGYDTMTDMEGGGGAGERYYYTDASLTDMHAGPAEHHTPQTAYQHMKNMFVNNISVYNKYQEALKNTSLLLLLDK